MKIKFSGDWFNQAFPNQRELKKIKKVWPEISNDLIKKFLTFPVQQKLYQDTPNKFLQTCKKFSVLLATKNNIFGC